jgi:hypothetical protein
MNLIAAYAHSTGATGLNALKQWALIAALALSSAAHAGYVKIANDGTDLPDSAAQGTNPTDWACTLDTATGLVWEVKTPANAGNTYTNYDSSYTGGTDIDVSTNSIGYVNTVNGNQLCGAANWRMPSKDELLGLVVPGSAPTINTTYFPNTLSSYFRSGSPYAGDSSYAWGVAFYDGGAYRNGRSGNYLVRLVRGGQSFEPLTVLATGTGSGSVDRSSWGAVCSRTNGVGCNSSVMWPKRGSSVTLTATPASGSAFTGWGGACSGTVGTSCTVTMDAAKGVSAAFTAVSTSSIVIDPATPANVYTALDGGGIYTSSNGGSTWTAASTQPSNTRVKALAIKPTATSTLFAATYGGGVFTSTNSGAAWSACATQPTNQNVLSIAMHSNGKLYAGTEAGVFVSADGCDSWTALNTGMP